MSRLRFATVAAALALCTALTSAQLKISQVYGGGGNIGAVLERDYVEIHNPTGLAVPVTGWSVQYTSATGTGTWQVTTLSGSVPAGGYYLVWMASGTPTGLSPTLPAADATGTSAMSATDGKVALCNDTVALTGAAPVSLAIQDLVGFGTLPNYREPTVGGTTANNAPNLLGGVVYAEYRRGCGGTDTDNNAADFGVGFPNPRNSATTPLSGTGVSGIGFASPHMLEEAQTTRLVVTPRVCGTDGNPALPVTVTADLTALGGGPADALVDDGTSGDEVAGDRMYSLDVMIPMGTPVGSYNIPLTFLDFAATSGGGTYINIRVNPASFNDNDNCRSATAVGVPSTTPWAISNVTLTPTANPEYNSISSVSGWTGGGSGFGSRRGIWYTVVGTGNTMTATTCEPANTSDMIITVFCGSCDGLTVVESDDDTGATPACGTTFAPIASWCSTMGQTYYICLYPFSTTATLSLTGNLLISDDGITCSGQIPCTTCPVPVPGGPNQREIETGFGPGLNDGCDNTTGTFTDLVVSFPLTVLGTARGYFNGRDTDWYRFQATSLGTVTATLNAQFQGMVSIHALGVGGACPATTLNASVSSDRCANTSAAALVTAGNWYAVRVLHGPTPATTGGNAPGATSYHYSVDLSVAPGAPNNNCANASILPFSATYTSSSTEGSSNDGSSTCDATGRDVWYTVTVSTPGDLSIDTCGSSIDTVLTLYTGTCGSLVEVVGQCNDDCGGVPCAGTDSCLSVPGIAPGTYYVRVSDKGLGVDGGAFLVRALFTAAGDNCTNAIPIFEGENGPFDNSTATDSGTFMTPAPCQALGPTHPGLKDLFFSYTHPANCGTVDIQTCNPIGFSGTNTDTQLMIYPISDCPGPPGLPIACNDDGGTGCGPSGFQSKLLGLALTGGANYLIRVASWGTGSGTFKITVTRHTAAFSSLGPGCSDGGGPGPTLTIDANPVLGTTRTLSITGALPVSPGMLFMSNPGASQMIPGGCTMYVVNGSLVWIGFVGTDITGAWSAMIPVPPDAFLECAEVYVQAFILPAMGPPFYQVTEGLRVVLGY